MKENTPSAPLKYQLTHQTVRASHSAVSPGAQGSELAEADAAHIRQNYTLHTQLVDAADTQKPLPAGIHPAAVADTRLADTLLVDTLPAADIHIPAGRIPAAADHTPVDHTHPAQAVSAPLPALHSNARAHSHTAALVCEDACSAERFLHP